MSRPFGSKNKPKNIVLPPAAPAVKAQAIITEPVPLPIAADLQLIYESLLKDLESLKVEYSADEVPDRLFKRAKAVVAVTELNKAQELAKGIKSAMLVHVLVNYGPNSGINKVNILKKKINSAMGLATLFEKQRLFDKVDATRARITLLQKELDLL